MIVYDLNIDRITIFPFEAYPPLLVDTDAELSLSCSRKCLKPICRGHFQIIQVRTSIKHSQLPKRYLLNVTWKLPGELTGEYFLGLFIFEAPNHSDRIYNA